MVAKAELVVHVTTSSQFPAEEPDADASIWVENEQVNFCVSASLSRGLCSSAINNVPKETRR